MTDQPLIHNVPFSKMSTQEQYDLVQATFAAALVEIAAVQTPELRFRLRSKLQDAMDKGTAMGQHAAIFAVRAITRRVVRKAQNEAADVQPQQA